MCQNLHHCSPACVHPASFGRSHQPLSVKLALEEMGTLFLKLGQLLSTRSDLLPPQIIAQLSLLQDKVAPFDAKIAIATIEHAVRLRSADWGYLCSL